MNLLEEYGYCIIPKGTVLYRQGALCHKYGCFFALHPHWAINVSGENKARVRAWTVEYPITVLFAISHLNQYGFGQCALSDIYRKHFNATDSLSSLDVKHANKEAKGKLQSLLQVQNIDGWLSTIEDKPPLEIFLMPGAVKRLKEESQQNSEDSGARNALREIEVFPATGFIEKAYNSVAENCAYLNENHRHVREDMYSLLQNIVFKI